MLVHTGAAASLHEVLRRTSPLVWGTALGGQLLSYGARAARLVACDRARYGGRFGTCLRLILLNNALNLVLPMRAGEASFPLLLKRWFGVDLAQGTGTLIWMRLLDLQVLAIAALLALGSLHRDASPAWYVAMGALALAPLLVWHWRHPLRRGLGTGRVGALGARVLQGLPDTAGLLLQAWAWTVAGWVLKLLVLGQLLAALAGLPFAAGLLGAVGGDLSTVLPIHSPGGFGSFEAALVLFVSPFREPDAALLAAALSFHLFVFGFALLLGLAAWLWPMPRATALQR